MTQMTQTNRDGGFLRVIICDVIPAFPETTHSTPVNRSLGFDRFTGLLPRQSADPSHHELARPDQRPSVSDLRPLNRSGIHSSCFGADSLGLPAVAGNTPWGGMG